MKNKIAIGIVFATLLVVIAFSGCVEEETPSVDSVEVIVISGIDKVTEINNDKPIKLVLSGVACGISPENKQRRHK